MLAHRTTSSFIVSGNKSDSNANATFVYLAAVSYWKCSRAHAMVESIICLSWPYCAGQAFSHLFTHGLRVLGPSHMTVSASAHTILQAVSALLPIQGGK